MKFLLAGPHIGLCQTGKDKAVHNETMNTSGSTHEAWTPDPKIPQVSRGCEIPNLNLAKLMHIPRRYWRTLQSSNKPEAHCYPSGGFQLILFIMYCLQLARPKAPRLTSALTTCIADCRSEGSVRICTTALALPSDVLKRQTLGQKTLS